MKNHGARRVENPQGFGIDGRRLNALNVELNFSKPKVEIKRIVNGI